MTSRITSLIGLLISAIYAPAFSQVTLPPVVVKAERPKDESYKTTADNDSTNLLSDQPGYNVAAGGGVSGLPIVNGLGDDRLNIRIDGMEIAAACGNHMNAPLSYVSPKQLSSIRLLSGVTPVSLGGDNIGGIIDVQTLPPVFASGPGLYYEGGLSFGARSVNHGWSTGVDATIANESLSLSYTGNHSEAQSYKQGGGDKVLDTLYESNNQEVLLAMRGDKRLVTLRVGEQHIPYQGFPNQYMDMTDNFGRYANLGYEAEYGWGKLTAKLYWQDTQHEMGFFTSERPGTMPMNTHGRNT